jgi:Phytanoyl-CoA dioxygenase (PhyH)
VTLVDPELDRRLQRDGFVVTRVLAADEAAALRDEFGRLHGWSGEGFHADLTVPDPAYRRTVGEALGEVLEPRVVPLFTDHQPFLYNYVCKFPGADSELYLHRDWMYVDERLGHRTHVVWTALEDIVGHNGQLQVLRGSHRLDHSLRGTELNASWMQHDSVIRERLESVPVRAGEAVIFDNALVHCSYPNLTDRPRVAAPVALRPASAPLVHFRRVDPATAVRYDVDGDFLYTYTPQELIAAPPPLEPTETLIDDQVELSGAELASRIDRCAGRRRIRTKRSVRAAFDRIRRGSARAAR